MADNSKKYVSLARLSEFLDNIKLMYSQIGHKHTTADLTDYTPITVDTALSPTSNNPVANSTLDAEFDAVSDALGALELAIDGKADKVHGHEIADVDNLQTTLDEKLSTSGGTMTGAITLTQANLVKRDKDTSSVSIYGGTESNNGATITAYGKEQAIYAGRFALKANNGESSAALEGIPDGTLKWNGKNVIALGTSEALPISSGGTNATTASEALSNLGGVSKTNPTISGSFSMNKLHSSTTGTYSVVEGYNCSATGNHGAHAEGYYTEANGNRSHAEGDGSIANGVGAHAEGQETIASCDYQHVQGKYNVEDSNGDYAHIVGNGESNSARSNAHTLDWDGNAWFAGNIYVGGTMQDDGSPVLVFRGSLTSDDDMDNVKDDGVYVYSTSSVPANAPYSNAAVVLVFGSTSTSSQKIQIGVRYGAAGKMSFRALYNNSWQNWTEVVAEIDGLVSAPKYEIAYDHRDQFFPYGAYGINLRNSDIYQANGIYFSHANDEDISDQFYEGLNFPRNDGKWDSIRVQEGAIKFVVGSTNDFGENNATKGTEYTVDYPVASGTSGVWTYRKWSSGIAECWGKVTTTGTSGTSSLGSATSMPYQMYTATFPFTFASAPVVTVGGVDGGTGLATASVSGEATKTSATLELVGSTAAIASGCYVYVIGKWK